jgi:teichuronic acid exporter
LGRSDLFLSLEIIKKVMVVISIAITWRWGISAMIYGMIVTSVISYYVNSYYNGVLIRYPIWEQLRDLFSYLLAAALMGVAVRALGLLPFPNHWSMLLGQVALGIVSYVGLCRILRLKAFMELWQAGWDKLHAVPVQA